MMHSYQYFFELAPHQDYIYQPGGNVMLKYGLFSCGSITNGSQEAIIWLIINARTPSIVIPINDKIGKAETASAQLNQVTNIAKESCQGVKFSLRMN